ncbi:MAG: hypothetical protein RIM99_10445 [Cyclobacteriaceae bacterium]
MKSISKLLTITLVTGFLISCGGGSGTENGQSAEELAEEKTIHDIDQLLGDLPPPSLVPFTLKKINAEFSRDLINSVENIEKYKGDNDKMSLNMGVFASDISYLAAYGHEEDCIDYLKASHKLAESLGDSAIYDDAQLALFRGHIKEGNEKEISDLLSKLFLKTSVQMEEDHHLTMAGLALTGSFVEGLYQAVITIETFPNTPENKKLLEPLVKIVMGEEQALLDIIEVLEDLPFDDTIADMITELSILDRLYKGDLQEIKEKMAEDPDFILTKDVMRDITLEVKRIRKSIVE